MRPVNVIFINIIIVIMGFSFANLIWFKHYQVASSVTSFAGAETWCISHLFSVTGCNT